MRFRCESCGAQYAISDEKLGKKGVKVRCKKCSNIITVRPQSQDDQSPEQQSTEQQPTEQQPTEEQSQEPAQDERQRDTTSVNSPSDAEQENEFGTTDESSPPTETDESDSSQSFGEGLDLGDDNDLHDALDGLLGDDGLGDELSDEDEDEQDADLDRQATRVFNVEEMQQVQAEREQASIPEDGVGEDFSSHDDSGHEHPASEGGQDRDTVEWYAAVDDEQVGPISLNEFARRWKKGEFDSDTLVWKSGFEDWLTVFDVAEFAFLAEEDSSLDEEPDGENDGEPDWSPSFGAQGESESFDDQEQDESFDDDADRDDEYEEKQDSYSGFDEDESSSTASAAAFSADVDWKPAALSSLSDLAEQELASLKPEDPEPEELPFDTDEESVSGDGMDFDAEMEDGDSSLVAQIAAEQEAIRRAQEEQAEEEKQDEVDQGSGEVLPEMDAQEKARKEKRAEQVIAASVPEERYIPPRASLPKWAIGLMVGGGLMVLTLVGVVGYLLAQKTSPETSTQPVVVPNTVPAAAGTSSNVAQPKVANATTVPSAKNQRSMNNQVASANGPDKKKGQETAPVEKATSASMDSGQKQGDHKDKDAVKTLPKLQAQKKNTATKKQSNRSNSVARKRKKRKSNTRVAMAPKEQKPIEKPKPKRRKSKGGLLDFEDPDDRAFAAEAGIKAPKVVPKVEKKKQLPPLSNADVLTVMKRHLAEFKACNRKQKEVDSTVRGKMVVSFTIGNNGRVIKVGVSPKTAKFKGTYVGGCIKSIIKRLKFPEFGGPKKKIPFPFTVN